ncbi:hypothetical protein [Streptomyces sp. NPDC055036]
MTDPAPRLLPADEHFLADFFDLEEPLLMWLDQTTRDARAGADDVYELPAGLDGEAAHEAWARIFAALPEGLRNERHALRTGEEVKNGNKVVGPDGYEYTPLYAVPADPADVEVLVALLDHFRKALARETGYADLHSILDDASEWYGNESADRVPENAEKVVARLARAVAVLQLQDDDAQALLAAVTVAGPDRRIVLTAQQEHAAARYFDRVITAVTEGKPPVERALARFVEFGDTGRPTV